MTKQLIFWVLMLIWAIFGIGWSGGWIPERGGRYGFCVLIFVLFLVLGWATFGAPVQ